MFSTLLVLVRLQTYGETCEDSATVVEPTEDKHMDEFS